MSPKGPQSQKSAQVIPLHPPVENLPKSVPANWLSICNSLIKETGWGLELSASHRQELASQLGLTEDRIQHYWDHLRESPVKYSDTSFYIPLLNRQLKPPKYFDEPDPLISSLPPVLPLT